MAKAKLYAISLKKVKGKHAYTPTKTKYAIAKNYKKASKKLGVSPYAMRTYGVIMKRKRMSTKLYRQIKR